jgi:FkbM family methyltransferase
MRPPPCQKSCHRSSVPGNQLYIRSKRIAKSVIYLMLAIWFVKLTRIPRFVDLEHFSEVVNEADAKMKRNNATITICIDQGFRQNFAAWTVDRAQERFIWRQDHLDTKSIVLDVGGYTGETAQVFWKRYQPIIFIAEPIKEYYDQLERRFAETAGKIVPMNFGFGNSSRNATITLNGDASRIDSSSDGGSHHTNVEIRTLHDFMASGAFRAVGQHIDLLFINCEGCEYEVLSSLVASSHIRKIKRILVQFHLNPGKDEFETVQQRCTIRQELRRTHMNYFTYPFIWEGWDLMDANTQ